MLSQSALLVIAFGLGLICCCVGETTSTESNENSTVISKTNPITTTRASTVTEQTTITTSKSASKSNTVTPSQDSTSTTIKPITTTTKPEQDAGIKNATTVPCPSNKNSQETRTNTSESCDKSLLSEFDRRVLELFFLGLPIGLVFVLMCILTAILLFVTKKHLKKSRDEETGSDIEDKAEKETTQQHQKETKSEESEKESNDQKTTEQDSDQKTEETNGQISESKTGERIDQIVNQKEQKNIEQISDQTASEIVEHDIEEKVQDDTERELIRKTQEDNGLADTVEIPDAKELEQVSNTPGTTKLVQKENNAIHATSTDKSEKIQLSEEKPQKESDSEGMNKTEKEFQTSIDILTSFIKETEDILEEKTCKQERKKDEIKKEERINSNVTSVNINDFAGNRNQGSGGELISPKQPDEKSITNNDKTETVLDKSILAKSEIDVKSEVNCQLKSQNEDHDSRNKTKETDQIDPAERDKKDKPHDIEKHMSDNEIDLPPPPEQNEIDLPPPPEQNEIDQPPPPEQNVDGKISIVVTVESVEPDLPLPPNESSDSLCASDESEKEDSE